MIVKVKLVTHSIIPNLNSGLVLIDPVGLVPFILAKYFLYLRMTTIYLAIVVNTKIDFDDIR